MAARRWGVRALTLVLSCALLAGLGISALALGNPIQGEVVNPVTPQPTVTIQGNLVTENGKPTGFYELALCVQSGYDYRRPVPQDDDDDVISKEEYASLQEDQQAEYEPYYYPFRSVSAAMYINTDILTPVNWDLSSVHYENFNGATYDQHDGDYPRGIDTDPAAQGYDMDEEDAFPDITTANLARENGPVGTVALDVEGDTRMTTVEGLAEHYDKDNHTALITLSAHAPDNYSVTLRQSTPVVVARFAYDLKRSSATKVLDTSGSDTTEAQRNRLTGESGGAGLWMGWDKAVQGTSYLAKTPLTWLGQSETAQDFTKSDARIAETTGHQTVWVHMGTGAAETAQQDTYFYYYLAAEGEQPQIKDKKESILVDTGGDMPESVAGVAIPKTAGERVLTPGESAYNEQTLPQPPKYNFFDNLLTLGKKTVVLELVNQPSFRKPTGGYGGNQILFYDWDDKLIGALIVGDGDVRAQVNAYVEQNFIHPDLRAGDVLSGDLGGTLPPDLTADTTDYAKLVSSLDREYTYRGKYAYQVGGDDKTLGSADGPEYPLTNKLDYVFTKRVNTVVTQTDLDGNETRYVHPYALDDAALAGTDAALYPYVYGWAVVEDTAAANGRVAAVGGADGTWKTMHDAAKLEDTWTTFGTGELSGMKKANMAGSLSTLAAPAGASAPTYSAPAFLAESDSTWTDGTRAGANQYLYQLSGESGYLRFADFSDITAEMARYQNKNTLIVKAVYEEGTSLLNGNQYTLVTEPAYTKWNAKTTTAGGAYRVQMTVERIYSNQGEVQGTTRVRQPVIQQDTTIDYKWLSDEEKNVLNDLDNATYETATNRTETLYTQVDSDNGEQITFSLALSPRQNRVDYVLVEQFGTNFIAGTQRSTSNSALRDDENKFVLDNYNYPGASIGDDKDPYYDCNFATKEGSRGFVLLGTLGHFLEQATRLNRREVAQMDYNNAVTFENAQDANLRMDMGGTQPTFANNTALRDAFLAAARQCEVHKNDSAYDCWDENLDCAKLTYHQAQLFLIDFQGDPGCDIRTVEAADGVKLPFCHYHVSCTGGHVPVPPKTWGDLVAKLQEYRTAGADSDDARDALADLSALDLNTLNDTTHLRKDGGARFSTTTEFVNALMAAEKALNEKSLPANWVNLQYTLLHSNTPAGDEETMKTEAQTDYWWYDGSNSAPRVNNFDALLAAAAKARTETTLPGETEANFLPQSALAAAQFPAEAEAYLTSDSPTRAQRNAWVTLTDNLVPSHKEEEVGEGDERYVDYTTEKFSSWADFLSAFNTAYDKADKNDPKPENAKAWWEAIQTAILGPDDDLGAHNGDETTKFWWRGGNTPFKITNLTTLVEAARRLNAVDHESAEYKAAEAEWNRLTVAEIEGKEISQSLRWKGGDTSHPMYPYAAAEDAAEVFSKLNGADEAARKAAILEQLKSAVQRFDAADPAVSLTWERIQYLILNDGALPESNTVKAQGNYYWWQNGNTEGNKVTLAASPIGTALENNIKALVQATYRSDFNDPGVIQSILDVTQAADNSFWSSTRLVTQVEKGEEFERHENDQYQGPDTLDEVKAYAYPGADEGDVQTLLDDLAEFRDLAKSESGVTDAYGLPTVYWHQVQYYLLNKSYLRTSDQTFRDLRDQEKAKAGDYWWYYANTRVPPAKPTPGLENPAAELVEWLEQLEDGSMDVDTFNSYLTAEKFTEWGIYQFDGSEVDDEFVGYIRDGMYEDLPSQIAGMGLVASDLTWPQLEVMFGGYVSEGWWNIPMDEAEAMDYLVNTYGALLQSDGGYIPDGYGPLYPDLFSAYASAALSTPFEILPLEALDTEDLLEKKAELERQLAQVEEQLAALEAAQTAPSTPSRPSQTPAQPETPAEPETPIQPETPAEPDAPAPSQPSAEPDTTVPSEPTTENNSSTSTKIPGERAEVPVGSDVVLAGRAPAEVEAEEAKTRPVVRPALPGMSLLLALDLPLLAGGRRKGRRGRRRGRDA